MSGSEHHFNAYRGTLGAFRTVDHYDHRRMPGGCGLTGSPGTDFGTGAWGEGSFYYLVVRGCPASPTDLEGGYGMDSAGASRPSAGTLGRAACP